MIKSVIRAKALGMRRHRKAYCRFYSVKRKVDRTKVVLHFDVEDPDEMRILMFLAKMSPKRRDAYVAKTLRRALHLQGLLDTRLTPYLTTERAPLLPFSS